MVSSKNVLTRRDFLKVAGTAALGTAIGPVGFADGTTQPLKKSTVVLVRDKDAVDARGQVNGRVVGQMIDDGLAVLLGVEDAPECWRQLVDPDDVVGIKSNEWHPLPTPREVELAIKDRLIKAGIDPDNLAIADRGVLGHHVFEKATALINVRPLRTHAWSGVGGLIKNYVMFVDEPSEYHSNSCASLGAIWHLPQVKGKTRLNILIVLTPLFYGVGPHHFDRSYVWTYNGILMGTDPVAVDTVGVRLLQIKRRLYFDENRPIKPTAHHIAFADHEYGLGTSDLEKIDLIKVGWEDQILI